MVSEIAEQSLIAERPVLSYGDVAIYPTIYVAFRGASLSMIAAGPFWGVGKEQHRKFVKQGNYDGLQSFRKKGVNPHSTYLGIFAETGIFSLLAFVGLLFFFFQGSILLCQSGNMGEGFLTLALPGIVFLFVVGAFNTDLDNMRHVYLFLAVANALSFSHKVND